VLEFAKRFRELAPFRNNFVVEREPHDDGPSQCCLEIARPRTTLLTHLGAFNDIFDMVITSVLQCFVTDEADFKDDPYATGALRRAIASDTSHKRSAWCCCGDSDDDEDDGLRRHFDQYAADGSGQLEKPELARLLETSTGAT
jgi:hypothetical protein